MGCYFYYLIKLSEGQNSKFNFNDIIEAEILVHEEPEFARII